MDSSDRFWRRWTWALFALHGLLICLTFLDYGVTYDEEWRLTYGEYVFRWYADGFERVPGPNNDAFDYWTLPNEAALFGTLVAALARISPLGLYETSHLLNAFFGLLGGVGAWRLGRLLSGERAGFSAALMLLLVPRWFGHSFHNPIDVPMATFTVWALGFLVTWVRALPAPRWRDTIALGFCLGSALGVRIGAVILGSFVGLAILLWCFLEWKRERPSWARVIKVLSVHGFALLVVAWLALLPWWPKAQVHPTHPFWALQAGLSFHQEIEVLFAGETILNQDVPRSYLSRWMLISLPGYLLVALVLSLFVFLKNGARLQLGVATVFGAVLVPLSFTWLTAPTDYDGMRHFLFLVPPLCVLAAVGIERLTEQLAGRGVRIALAVVLGLGMTLTAVDMVRLHPYQSVYFNRIAVGGLAGAHENYELDYWGASFREAVEWIHENSETGGRRVKVGSSMWPGLVTEVLDAQRFEYVGSVDHPRDGDQRPELYIATERWGRLDAYPGEVIHRVERLGVPLAYIKRVRPEAESN